MFLFSFSPMRRPTFTILAALLALGAIEGIAWWWMHPPPAGLGEPVLVYRPGWGGHTSEIHDQGPEISNSDIKSLITAHPSSINSRVSSTPILTPLPDVYQQAAPTLRCSTGQVFHARLDGGISLHLAFFEWNHSDTGSVLEAFRHMPEACMGSIGMTLVSKEKPISYNVGGETLIFDHTVFRDPRQGGNPLAPSPLVHAFRAVWVAGMTGADARAGIGGDEFNRLRTIRLKSAVSRFRPSHARVIQAAVRGVANRQSAWQAFEKAMLKDLGIQ